MNLTAAIDLAHSEMGRFPQLEDWRFIISQKFAARSYGKCYRVSQKIVLAEKFILLNTYNLVRQVILHEIAHALTPGHHHDHVWKAMARSLGIPDTRFTYEANKPKQKFVAICEKCQRIYYRNVRTTKKLYCGNCTRFHSSPLLWMFSQE